MSIPTEQLDPISRKLISRGVPPGSRKRASPKAHQTVNVNAPSTGPPSAEQQRDKEERLIAEPECRRRSGLSRAQRWRLERDGIPRRLRLGPRTVRWRLSEILTWIADLPTASPELSPQ
jgi:predicted DNA-binding transcriptional regulator AlpA